MVKVQTLLNNIRKIIFKNKMPHMLGRWQLSDKTKVNIKIDLSNEDHCGGCNDLLEKYKVNKKIEIKN